MQNYMKKGVYIQLGFFGIATSVITIYYVVSVDTYKYFKYSNIITIISKAINRFHGIDVTLDINMSTKLFRNNEQLSLSNLKSN